MERRRLGGTAVEVSRFILGCGNFGGIGSAPEFFGQGETDAAALIRELAEELGIDVAVGPRLGEDVALSGTTTLRAYLVTQTCDRVAHAHDHAALRWVGAAELESLDWVPADRGWVPELRRLL